ncbi:hypothetical protein GCM10023206_07430 [Acinetobacter puyangensis]|uniref:Uncharacterized protein n=1 Tax=Acinetobacter puyangensis TaxID=1096779 RepID=A0A240E5Z8_9GAMM|nr:hypothetical protein [Acinetobacter puyangensis]SNX44177.1 hypothetical protein SAMN05421731_102338 [Acinetobacter puyangensis]
MKIKEQFFVIKNLKTGQFVCSVGSDNHKSSFTRLLTAAKCFQTHECAEDAIETIRVFFTSKEAEAAKADDHPEYRIEDAQRNYEKFAKNLVICKLTRTHSISKGVER